MAELDNKAGTPESKPKGRIKIVILATVIAALAAVAGVAFLVNIMERKQEAKNPFYRVVELTDETEDPAIWGRNFPLQYDGYRRTVDQVRTRFGGSEAEARTPTEVDPRSMVAQSRLEEDPRLKQMWAGYAFAKASRRSTPLRLRSSNFIASTRSAGSNASSQGWSSAEVTSPKSGCCP